MIAMRQGMHSGKTLPYDAEVEWLESTGTQWIDVPITAVAGQYFGISGEMIANSSCNGVFCEANVVNQFTMFFYSRTSEDATFATYVGGNSKSGGVMVKIETKDNFILSTEQASSLGKPIANIRPLLSNLSTIRFFAPIIQTFRPNLRGIKLCNVSIKNGVGIISNLIPVRVGDVGYMYDRVSGELFGNQGTGAFLIGPDK